MPGKTLTIVPQLVDLCFYECKRAHLGGVLTRLWEVNCNMADEHPSVDVLKDCVMLSLIHPVKASRAVIAADQFSYPVVSEPRNPWTQVVIDELHIAMSALERTGRRVSGVGAHVKQIEGPGTFDTADGRASLTGLEGLFPVARRVDRERLGFRPEVSTEV